MPAGETNRIVGELHANDYRALRKLLIDEDLSVSRFLEACVESYINGDPHMMRIVQRYKERHERPAIDTKGDELVLSKRERDKLLEELEGNDGEG